MHYIVHYFHNSFDLNDQDEGDHLPNLCTMDGVRDLSSLFAVIMFLNIFNDWTYQSLLISANQTHNSLQKVQDLFDLNAIPVVERLHFCYTRGLVLDLVFWFFDHYSLLHGDYFDKEINGYQDVLIPFLVHVGRPIICYKHAAVSCGYYNTGTKHQIWEQICSVLFCYPEIKEEFKNTFLLIIRQVTLATKVIPSMIQEKYMIWVLTSPALVLASINSLLVTVFESTISSHKDKLRQTNTFLLVYLVNLMWMCMVWNIISYSTSKLIANKNEI